METTLLLAKVVGPVLIVRGVSILIDPKHFRAMLDGLEKEIATVSFSMVPVAVFMAGLALAVTHTDASSLAGIIFYLIAWGAILKSMLLMLFPRLIAAKARALGRAGFLHLVCIVCLAVGVYLSWFGYFA